MVNIIFSYLIDNKIVIISFTKIGNGLETSEIQPIVLFCIHSKNIFVTANIRFTAEKSNITGFYYPKISVKGVGFHVPPNYNLPSVR